MLQSEYQADLLFPRQDFINTYGTKYAEKVVQNMLSNRSPVTKRGVKLREEK